MIPQGFHRPSCLSCIALFSPVLIRHGILLPPTHAKRILFWKPSTTTASSIWDLRGGVNDLSPRYSTHTPRARPETLHLDPTCDTISENGAFVLQPINSQSAIYADIPAHDKFFSHITLVNATRLDAQPKPWFYATPGGSLFPFSHSILAHNLDCVLGPTVFMYILMY
eukprot:956578-Amorphochlora_amoeboformis.AAC.1